MPNARIHAQGRLSLGQLARQFSWFGGWLVLLAPGLLPRVVDPAVAGIRSGTTPSVRIIIGDGVGGGSGEAIERLGRTRMRPAAARARLLYGEWLRRENRRRDARAELRTAHDLFTTMGIEAFAERARRELLAAGDTVRKPTAGTAGELIAQEAHIARLAVDGRTSVEIGAQLFLSTRTIEWHLGKVYAKLGVGSRRELRQALASPGPADPPD